MSAAPLTVFAPLPRAQSTSDGAIGVERAVSCGANWAQPATARITPANRAAGFIGRVFPFQREPQSRPQRDAGLCSFGDSSRQCVDCRKRQRGRGMRIGVTMFPTDYASPPHELAVEAEARGFESVWFPEHSHIPTSRKSPWPGGAELPKWYYDSYDPFVAMGAAAVVTKTIKLGTGVCLVVQRDPIHTAKEVATVDRLSGGRLVFGIGGGWNAEEMADHGTAFPSRFKLMRERIEAMKEIWGRSTR